MKLKIAALATMIALPVAAQMSPAASKPDAQPGLQAPAAKVEPHGAKPGAKSRTPKASVKGASTKSPKKKKSRTSPQGKPAAPKAQAVA